MKKNLVLGIPSGSLFDSTVALLRKVGIEVVVNGRNFMAEIRGSDIFSRAIIMRPNDLPLALKNGIVDGIITGLDMCLESGLEKELCIIIELNFSKKSKVPARVVIFCRENDSDEIVDSEEILVSAEYINLAKTIFKKAQVFFSTGSTEIKVAIEEFGFRYGVGVVESGKSLKDNNLKIVKVILTTPVIFAVRKENLEFQIFGQMLKGALEAEMYQLVKFNADSKDKDRLIEILPAMESPTISNLADGMIAIETVITKETITDSIIAIRKNGGRNILVQNINISV
ncbi:MAG: ATP phosphoribosyltransferase [Candidatus Moranbacteria bacterium GW2011_GWF2_36_839]|nr:MAG: ATP phosphoribosyltransferase [Candidatus Moranbacteria bacterium GW2011_GWF1_36_78]KKQ16850.1 MAG: ATP phosphoribosyltransferase [Candidatus Moranbacteria bacterium GW2011_GWF2_36_839]HAT74400.1 hypothetical protein [Candidatus Moranbacteria bacterium]HBY11152.1 hypothetical protein [Candidatus Moranbacteria bacterium]